MSLFEVTITTKRGGKERSQRYDVRKDSHHDTAVLAAEEALRTFANHGHSKFPFNGGGLLITVAEVDESV